MRQGQQNRRGRGRNRKGQSPLTRSFESTGPDVKIRGTPAHIAEKYMTLARDATTSGDPVLAENYLQHAEHYNRIIMAFREQNVGPNGEQLNGGMNRDRPYDPTDMADEFDDDGDDGDMQQPSMAPMRQEHQPQPQPRSDNQRFDNHRGNNDQQRYRDRNDRNYRNDRQDRPQQRPERHDRPEQRPEQRHDRPDRGFQQQAPRPQNNDAGPVEAGAPPAPDRQPRRERFVPPTHEQPEFLRRPVRRPRREGNGAPPEEANGAPIAAEETDHD